MRITITETLNQKVILSFILPMLMLYFSRNLSHSTHHLLIKHTYCKIKYVKNGISTKKYLDESIETGAIA